MAAIAGAARPGAAEAANGAAARPHQAPAGAGGERAGGARARGRARHCSRSDSKLSPGSSSSAPGGSTPLSVGRTSLPERRTSSRSTTSSDFHPYQCDGERQDPPSDPERDLRSVPPLLSLPPLPPDPESGIFFVTFLSDGGSAGRDLPGECPRSVPGLLPTERRRKIAPPRHLGRGISYPLV